jgi:hypothetical protein
VLNLDITALVAAVKAGQLYSAFGGRRAVAREVSVV